MKYEGMGNARKYINVIAYIVMGIFFLFVFFMNVGQEDASLITLAFFSISGVAFVFEGVRKMINLHKD